MSSTSFERRGASDAVTAARRVRGRRATLVASVVAAFALGGCGGGDTVVSIDTVRDADGDSLARTGASRVAVPPPTVAPTTTIFTSPYAPGGDVVNPGPGDVLAAAPDASGVQPTLTVEYGPHDRQRIDLYLPDGPGPHPVLVYFHSGGWIDGSHHDVLELVRTTVGDGWAVASAGYRLAPEVRWPVPVQDAKHAVRFLKAHGGEWNLDTGTIVASGYSAGGHLAAMVGATVGELEPDLVDPATAQVDSSIDAVVSLAAPVDIVSFGTTLFLGTNAVELLFDCDDPDDGVLDCDGETVRPADPGAWGRLAPARGQTLPPAYVVHGALDPLVLAAENGGALVDAWRAAGGTAWYDLVDDRGHRPLDDGVNLSALREFLAAVRAGRL